MSLWSPVAAWWAGPGPADESHNPPHDTLAVPAAPYALFTNQDLRLSRVNSKFPLYNAPRTPWHIRPNPNWAAFDLRPPATAAAAILSARRRCVNEAASCLKHEEEARTVCGGLCNRSPRVRRQSGQ